MVVTYSVSEVYYGKLDLFIEKCVCLGILGYIGYDVETECKDNYVERAKLLYFWNDLDKAGNFYQITSFTGYAHMFDNTVH